LAVHAGREAGCSTFLERTWSGLTGLVKPRSAATMFRLADQYRHEGRYEEAADLIAEGLRVSPNIAVGHLLDAYLHVVFREMPAAKTSFRRVLSLDPYHPRALFGLARIALEEGDIEGCRPFLDRAIQYFPDFPEAKALQEMVATWSAPAVATPSAVGAINTERLRLPPGAHDLILTHADESSRRREWTRAVGEPEAELARAPGKELQENRKRNPQGSRGRNSG